MPMPIFALKINRYWLNNIPKNQIKQLTGIPTIQHRNSNFRKLRLPNLKQKQSLKDEEV